MFQEILSQYIGQNLSSVYTTRDRQNLGACKLVDVGKDYVILRTGGIVRHIKLSFIEGFSIYEEEKEQQSNQGEIE